MANKLNQKHRYQATRYLENNRELLERKLTAPELATKVSKALGFEVTTYQLQTIRDILDWEFAGTRQREFAGTREREIDESAKERSNRVTKLTRCVGELVDCLEEYLTSEDAGEKGPDFARFLELWNQNFERVERGDDGERHGVYYRMK